MHNDVSCVLKRVSQCYVTLQRCDGRRISVVADFRITLNKKKTLFIQTVDLDLREKTENATIWC